MQNAKCKMKYGRAASGLVFILHFALCTLHSSAFAQLSEVSSKKPVAPKFATVDTNAEVALGHLFFFEKRLSRDDTIACVTCHQFERGLTDNQNVSLGIQGQAGERNAPPCFNLEDDGPNSNYQFWDGVTFGLDAQADRPLRNPKEMGNRRSEDAAAKLNRIPGYLKLAKATYGRPFVLSDITRCLAQYERTLVINDSPWDKYQAGDTTAMTASQVHGREVFEGLGCTECHDGPNLRVANRFENLGIAFVFREDDLGLGGVERAQGKANPRDRSFKVPTLRNLADTAPYGHKGEFADLDAFLDHLNRGGADLGGRADPRTNKSILALRGEIAPGQDREALKDYLLNACRGTLPFDVAPALP
jgi:cytochrome c peroxidase